MAAAGERDAPYTEHVATLREVPPPVTTTFTWTLRDLSTASFTDAAPGDEWCSPEFRACGVRWALEMLPAWEVQGTKFVSLYLTLREPNCTGAGACIAFRWL